MNYDRTERIRRAAILVASLDEALAEQMLRSLPEPEAARVTAEVERLESIDPEEQRDVLEEFRRVTRHSGAAAEKAAVEFTYSAPSPKSPAAVETPVDSVANAFSEADLATLVELLSSEHPQIIAAALSRLGDEPGAEAFAALPPHLHEEVLDRIANLEAADEDALVEVESQLRQRIECRRERRQGGEAGVELARRIVAKTPRAQQAALLERLGGVGGGKAIHAKLARQPLPSTASRAAPPNDHGAAHRGDSVVAQQAAALASAVQHSRGAAVEEQNDAPVWRDGVDDEGTEGEPLGLEPSGVLDDRSGELEQLSDRALLGALRMADEQLVQRALAASSERFIRRVAGKLPRKQAVRLRQLLRSLGPTRIADLRQAQHELLRIAHQCQ